MKNPRTNPALLLTIVSLALTGFCVFVLPYYFPTSIPSFSHSYMAGYSNRVAALGVVVLAGLAFLGSLWLYRGHNIPIAMTTALVSRQTLFWAAVAYVFVLTILATISFYSPRYFGETGYFLHRLNRMVLLGEVPNRNFEFIYGPILLYFPLAVHKLLGAIMPLEASYYLSTIAMMLVGLGMLFWIVNHPIVSFANKKWVFLLVAFALLNGSLGQNYTPVRFLIAPVLLLSLQSLRTAIAGFGRPRRFVLFALCISGGSILACGISPEAGAALGIANSVFLFLSAAESEWWLLSLIPFCFAGFPAMFAMFGSNYMSALFAFSGGFANFPIPPAPYILLYLATVVVLVPFGVALTLLKIPGQRSILLSLWLLGLIYVSAALGRCDLGHVVFNGVILFILGFSFCGLFSPRLAPAYMVAFAIFVAAAFHVGDVFLYRGDMKRGTYYAAKKLLPAETFRAIVTRFHIGSGTTTTAEADQEESPDFSLLESARGVATPLATDKRVDAYLFSHKKFVLDYFTWMARVSDPEAMNVKLQTLRTSPYVLADLKNCCDEDNREWVEKVLLFPLRYRVRNQRYSEEGAVRAFIQANFDQVGSISRYGLYRNRSIPAESNRH